MTRSEPSSRVRCLILLWVAVIAGGCNKDRTVQQPRPSPDNERRAEAKATAARRTRPGGGGQKPGACKNVHLADVSCELLAVAVTGDAARQRGSKVVHVSHRVEFSGQTHALDTYQLAVPETKVAALRAFFRAHSPVPCKGTIVRPPCNPAGTAVRLQLTLPDYVAQHR